MGGIFLSYSRADRAHAYRIVQGMRALGVAVWWDEDMPGVDWQYELEQRITDMAAVLVLWSNNSKSSKNVRDEARLADKKDKLINALVGLAEPPHPFDRNNGLQLDGWDGREPHRGWSRLVQTAETYLVKAGDTAPQGTITATLAQLEQNWRDQKLALALAQDAFREARTAVTEASAAAEMVATDLTTAQEDLARLGEGRFSSAILRAAQQDYDAKAAIMAEAEAAHRAARARLSDASREVKRHTVALKAPAHELPAAPITRTPAPEALDEQRRVAKAKQLAAEQRERELAAEAEARARSAETAQLAAIAREEADRLTEEKRRRDLAAVAEAAEQAVAAEAARLAASADAEAKAKQLAEAQRLADGRAAEQEAERARMRAWLRKWLPLGLLVFGAVGAIGLLMVTSDETPSEHDYTHSKTPIETDLPQSIDEMTTLAPSPTPPLSPEQAAKVSIMGAWALEGIACTDPVTFSEKDRHLVVSFAGESLPLTIEPSAPATLGGFFRAGDGSVYRLDQNGALFRMISGDTIRMTKCAD